MPGWFSREEVRRRAREGICLRCNAKATHGQLCEKHRKLHAVYKAKVQRERREAGICQRCQDPVAPGNRSYCERHRAMQRQWARARYSKGHARQRQGGPRKAKQKPKVVQAMAVGHVVWKAPAKRSPGCRVCGQPAPAGSLCGYCRQEHYRYRVVHANP